MKGDIYRITNGIDDCGNVCGRENKANELPHCGVRVFIENSIQYFVHSNFSTFKPSDKRDKQFTFINITKTSENITNVHLTCVPSCNDIPGYQAVSNRCLRSKDEKSTSGNNFKPSTNDKELIMMVDMMDTISEDLTASWSSIVVACFITLAMSFILLGLFRYATQSVFYLSYIGFVVTSFIASYKLFIYGLDLRHSTVPRLFSPTYVIIASILVGLIGLLSACFFCCAQKRISSVIKLYKEASKIFVDVPLIMVKPLFTFFAIGVSSVALIYFFLVIKSSGNLKTQTDSSGTFIKATYVQNAALVTAHFLNIIGYLFFVSFFYGCQNFIIACTVCQWFFSRDKKDIGSPIVRSFFLMFRFHLGSVCLGGLVITAVKIVRILTETMNVIEKI